MKKTVKGLSLVLICILCVSALASCWFNNNSSGGNQAPSGSVDTEVIYSPNVNANIILGEGVRKSDVSLIKSAYFESLGKDIYTISPDASKRSHEIIVGKTEHELSVKAYRTLELTERAEGDVGYVIYSDGKSVAIAFDGASFGENVALAAAVEDFVATYMTSNTLKLGSGIVRRDTFDPIEKQAERDEKTLDLLWDLKLSQITEKVGGNSAAAEAVVTELEKFYSIYNIDYSTVKWLANLYDPETGGFYYSNSARNNVGYLPDLESTSQALSIIELVLSGYGGTLTDYFGEEIADKFVSFAKDMQDTNGYFYHPQWSTELIDKNISKRKRDVTNALLILDFFGATPRYDTLNGVAGESAASPTSKMTAPLATSSAISVSKVVSCADDEIYIPNHLKTKESFESYLSGLKINSNTAAACEALYAEVPLYLAIDEILEADGASYRLIDVLKKHLANSQRSSTGLWSSSAVDLSTAISEVASVVKIYDALSLPVSNYIILLDTIVSAIEDLEAPEEICDVVDLWVSLYSVVNNLKSYTDELGMTDVDWHLEKIYQRYETLIKKTVSVIGLFAESDGSFSSLLGSSSGELMGMPISPAGIYEGDMSATLLATNNLWLSVFGVLDIGNVPIFTTSDRMMFQKTFLDMGIIIKNEVKKVEPIDFEDYDVGDVPDIRHQFNSGDSRMEIINDAAWDGNAARLYSASNKGEKFDFFYVDVMSSVTNATCYSYELDMCVLPDTSKGTFAQLYLYQDVYMISLKRTGDTINFYENSSRTSGVNRTMDIGVSAKVGEWFSLRIEYYPGPRSSVRIKVYFNDECVVVSDNYFGSHKETNVPSTNFSSFCIYGYQKMTMDVCLDNVVVDTTYKAYTVEPGRLNRNVDYPEKAQTIHGFDAYNNGDTPSQFIPSAQTGAAVTTDSDGNKLLAVSEKIGDIALPIDSRGAGINSAHVEFDFVLSDKSKSGAVYQISFNEYKYDNTVFGSMYIIIKEEGGRLYATLSESASETDSYGGVKIFAGEKRRIGFHLFFDEQALLATVDGVAVGVNANVDEVKRYYLGEIKLLSVTPSISSEILIDNVIAEKVAASFEVATAPEVDRVVNEFDTTEGLELLGVSPVGGALSFERASGKAYVKIPVNVRASAPTMALVGVDVSSNGGSGSVNVSLSDKSGNIIATFALVSSGSDVSIYEVTENGRYSAPIYTFSDQSFNFSFEYNESKGNFNLLINGEYVAATSITYSRNSTDYSFEYLTVGCSGRSCFTIDNLYAERICGVFKSHQTAVANKDPVNGVFTYETSSFASMPSAIERILGDASASHSIKEAKINGVVSKVLEMNCGTGKSATFSVFKKTQTVPVGNAVFFETDIMMETTTTALQMYFEFQGSSTAYSVIVTCSGEGVPLQILGEDIGVNEGEWFKFRIEYRDVPDDFNYDGKSDVVTRIYVNDVLVSEGYTPSSANNVIKTSDVSKLRVRNTSGRAGIVYLDNTILDACDMSYTPPAPADTDTLTYEPGVITDKTQATFGNTASKLTILKSGVSGNVTNVLNFYTSKDSVDKLTIAPTSTVNGANAIMFETEILIDPVSDTASLYLDPLTSGGKQAVRFTIEAEKNGKVTLYSKNSSGVNDSAIPSGIVIGNSGEWIKLKIEYMNPRLDYTGDGVDDILCRIYVDGILKATLYQSYKPGSFYDPSMMNRFLIFSASETDANVYFDNTKFWRTNLVYDEPPVKEPDIIIGGNGSADGKYDPNGWQ